jgi:hypothetical protein
MENQHHKFAQNEVTKLKRMRRPQGKWETQARFLGDAAIFRVQANSRPDYPQPALAHPLPV